MSKLDLQPLTLDDLDKIYKYTSVYGENSCQHSPVSLFSTFEKYGDDEAIFDAENQSRIWEVYAATININGLTFKNGK